MTDYCKDTDGQNAIFAFFPRPQAAGRAKTEVRWLLATAADKAPFVLFCPAPRSQKCFPEVGLHKPKTKKRAQAQSALCCCVSSFNIIAIGVVLLLELRNERILFCRAARSSMFWERHGLLFHCVSGVCGSCDVRCVSLFVLIKECGYGKQAGICPSRAILGKYYDNTHTLEYGGQPFQMAYMVRANIDTPTACSLSHRQIPIRSFLWILCC
jgi:hypothetical protein